jgi:uncharacterized protein (DUF486 family)
MIGTRAWAGQSAAPLRRITEGRTTARPLAGASAQDMNPLPASRHAGALLPLTFNAIMPIVLLVASNVFMTTAWYGHLKFPGAALWVVVMVSWGIAFVEYWLAVPANRIGYGAYSAAELKTVQEVISLTVFAGFAVFVLGEKLTWNHGVGFALIAAGAFFIFKGPLR